MVSPILIGTGSCHYDQALTFSPGMVPVGAMGALFFPLSFFNHIFSNSFMSFFIVICSALELFPVHFVLVVHEDSHQDVLSFRGLSLFFSKFVLNPCSDPSCLRFRARLCGIDMEFDNFPRSRSSSSCHPTSRKVSLTWSSLSNLKYDDQWMISCRSLLSTLTFNAIPVRPALMLRDFRKLKGMYRFCPCR